ncbi:hypothetical protein MPDQ_004630 [Monascus purpureus]|uniref:Uncharacterized protein n=1 Tax=Monascus purpureus TaxID=5098 RepID=A0A507QXX4_MONPU|nr:hypothetical protein MPDQ_004630 [Monascus purpureus]BDD60721.1 hypothetical protein MAP00_005821 [Monascus purpureus]
MDGLLKAHPVAPTSLTLIHPNAAFQTLAYDPEMISNRTAPDIPYGVIPGNLSDSDWDILLGDETPAGGLCSSAKDMTAGARAILNSPAVTRRWIGPVVHAYFINPFSCRSPVEAPW